MHLIYAVSKASMVMMFLYLHVTLSMNWTWNKASVIHGWGSNPNSNKIINGNVTYLKQVFSSAMCALGCVRKPLCTAASYSHKTRICAFYSKTKCNLHIEDGAELFRFVDTPVAVLIDANLTSVSAAASMCDEVGLRLINPDQLNDTVKTYNFIDCRCGWVDDEANSKYTACNHTVTPCNDPNEMIAYCAAP